MNMNNAPGFGSNAESAKATHDLFMAYIDAGFSRQEALALIIGILAGAAKAQLPRAKQ